MNILVSECDQKNNLNSEKLDKIILSNNKIEKSIIDIKLQIDNIIKTSSNNSLNIQLKNINNILKMINEDIKKNNENLNNLFSDWINTKNNNKNIRVLNAINTKSNSENVYCSKNGNLLRNIKSKYFSRIIFSYLNAKNQLKIIKYNKRLQNNMDIKLINYKFYSGKYIIYEKEMEKEKNTIIMVN